MDGWMVKEGNTITKTKGKKRNHLFINVGDQVSGII